MGAEACNAIIDVSPTMPGDRVLEQEVACISLGLIYEIALTGFSYSQYVAEVHHCLPRTSNGLVVNDLLLSDGVCKQIQNHKLPTNLTDVYYSKERLSLCITANSMPVWRPRPFSLANLGTRNLVTYFFSVSRFIFCN